MGTEACRARSGHRPSGERGRRLGIWGRADAASDEAKVDVDVGGCALHRPAVDLSNYLSEDEAERRDAELQASARGEETTMLSFLSILGSRNSRNDRDLETWLAKETILGGKIPLPTGGGFATMDVAVLTRRGYGYSHEVNQDRSFVVLPYLPFEPPLIIPDEKINGGAPPVGAGGEYDRMNDFLMGVFDGHGSNGQATAHLASESLPSVLATELAKERIEETDRQHLNDLMSAGAVKRALVSTFLAVDAALPPLPTSGCTASVTLRLGNRLYVANAGDSQTFVVAFPSFSVGSPGGQLQADGPDVQILYRSRPDKPDLPEERNRIERLGGTVYIPDKWALETGDSSRVITSTGKDPVIGELEDPDLGSYGLAMSRSMGDIEVKAVGVVAVPIVDALVLDNLLMEASRLGSNAGLGAGGMGYGWELFVVSATDGLFERVPEIEFASGIAKSLRSHDAGGSGNPLVACEEIIMKASEVWLDVMPTDPYRDDISLVVTRIRR